MSDEQQLNELAALAAEAAAEDATRGEYIPGSGAPEAEPQGPSTGEMVAGVLAITFGLVAARRGAHWNLSAAEAQQAGEAYGAVLDKYFPDMKAGPEVAAVAVTAMIVLPRLAADRAAADREEGRTDGDQSE